jgi:tRNA-modifying protein YgfZ
MWKTDSEYFDVRNWGVMEVRGDDAAAFLHNQITQDVLLLPVGQARLAAYCSPKGRMLASFVVFKRAPDWLQVALPADVLPGLLKRLSMFVMRSKAKLSDASTDWRVIGEWAAGADGLKPWEANASDQAISVGLYPAQNRARALCLLPATSTGPAALDADLTAWQLSEVLSGVAFVQAAQADKFVPQMLNYESIGGVNFKKGCYPGQEVVARSQFRGAIKRRSHLAASSAAMSHKLAIGQMLLNDAGDEVAEVVASATTAHGTTWAWLCVQGDAPAQLFTAEKTALVLQPAPYALLTDI